MRSRRRPGWMLAPVALLCAGALARAAPAVAQEAADGTTGPAEPEPDGSSFFLVDAETRVSDVDFRFVDGAALDEEALRGILAFQGPGSLSGLRAALDFLPGISTPELRTFSPLLLQRDLARLRRHYQRAGFPDADLDYDLALDTTNNEIAVTWVIVQGQPVVIDSVSLALPELADGASLAFELEPEWERYVRELQEARGRRFGEQESARLEDRTVEWLLHRGYPWAEARVQSADTVERRVHALLTVTPGPRARVADVEFEGQRRLSEPVLAREVPVRPGDWYDARAVTEGQAQIYELDLVRRALGGVASDQPRDTLVRVTYRIEETQLRLIWGRAGWRSEAGIAAELHWSHRNFFGGARTFTISSSVETGWAALEQVRGRSAGVSATVRQPYVWHRNLSATFGPFLRVRNDFRDRSILYGLESALIWRVGPLETLTLQHEISRSRVDEAFQLIPVAELASTGERPYDRVFVRSIFRLSAAYGTLDDRLDPSSGYLVEPSIDVTGPPGISDVDFVRFGLTAAGVVPLIDGFAFRLRGSGGRLFPLGDSRPDSPETETRAVVGLRGVMFTAGGTSDVRGWASGSLGPKIPDVEIGSEGTIDADRYVPVGGLARITGSAEILMPFPFLSDAHRTFAFVDAGRVWTPGSDFEPGDPELAIEPWGVGVGGGMQFATPVGPVRLAVGYKANPSRIDLLAPDEVARDLAVGGDLSSLETHSLRRWHLHLSIGQGL